MGRSGKWEHEARGAVKLLSQSALNEQVEHLTLVVRDPPMPEALTANVNGLYVQRHLIACRTLRTFRSEAMATWKAATAG
jgi:hypothetical protein